MSRGGGAAVIIPAGFGEGMTVNAMTALYGMFIVSKVHKDAAGKVTQKRLHMIATSGTPANWTGVQLSRASCAAAIHAMAGVADRVFFMDSDGPQSLSPSAAGAYGDIAVDTKLCPRVRPLLAGVGQHVTQSAVHWVRNWGQLWFIVRSGAAAVVAVYHPMQGGGAWTELQFPMVPRCLCEVGERVYLAGDDGRVYLLAPTGTDWTSGGDREIFTTLRTRRHENMGGDLILRGVKLGIGRILPSSLRVEAVDANGFRYHIAEEKTLPEGNADQKIYAAADKIAAACWKISGGNAPLPQYFDWKANVRKAGMSLQIRSTGGRVVFENISGVFAVVG